MPRSYKVCVLIKFAKESISKKKLSFGAQIDMPGVDPGPSTQIYLSRDRVTSHDFTQYTIEHEVEESINCRVDGKSYTKIIRMGRIDAFQSPSNKLLFLSGRKADTLDFCRRHCDHDLVQFRTMQVNMGELLKALPSVKGVWFAFANGQVRASALMGHNLEATPDFKHFKTNGTISTLSFGFETKGQLHPVMVTEDGTIVLQGMYKSRSEELDLALAIKTQLLDKLLTVHEPKKKKKKK